MEKGETPKLTVPAMRRVNRARQGSGVGHDRVVVPIGPTALQAGGKRLPDRTLDLNVLGNAWRLLGAYTPAYTYGGR